MAFKQKYVFAREILVQPVYREQPVDGEDKNTGEVKPKVQLAPLTVVIEVVSEDLP